jgi:hypothetical protein
LIELYKNRKEKFDIQIGQISNEKKNDIENDCEDTMETICEDLET